MLMMMTMIRGNIIIIIISAIITITIKIIPSYRTIITSTNAKIIITNQG